MTGYVVVLITAGSSGEGKKIAQGLVEKRLCACVNILPGVRSIYRWEGEVQDDGEVLLLCKARSKDFDGIQNAVKELHSYSVPEIIALPVADGSRQYLDWVSRETE